MNIYCRIPQAADCGVGYYRQYLPLLTARKKGKIAFNCEYFTFGERTDDQEPSDEDLQKAGKWADLFYFARNDVPHYISKAGAMKEFYKKPSVMDVDDNVQATRPYNPGYRSFHPNSPNMVWNIKSMGVFDALTVSTDNLKEYYSEYMPVENIYVCPNSLDWEERDNIYNSDFSNSELFKKKDGEIRIGWHGSAAHWENLKHIEQAIMCILRDYPETTFYYTGLFGDLFKDEDVKDRVHATPWSNLKDWPKFNREMNLDIALAPLADNMFNRAKSNLRLLEYASARYAVIASPVLPYQGFDGDVLYAKEEEEWYDKIEYLVKNQALVKGFSTNLYNTAKKKFNIDKNYKVWLDAFKDIKKKFK